MIIEVHLAPITTQLQRDVIFNRMNSNYKWSGRDVFKLKNKLEDIIQYNKIKTGKEYILDSLEIVKVYTSMENSKKHKKDNYLEDEEDVTVNKPKRIRKVLTDDEKIAKAKAILNNLEKAKNKQESKKEFEKVQAGLPPL